MSEQNGQGPGLPPSLQPRPVPTGWQAKPVVFRQPGRSLHMTELTFFTPLGQQTMFFAPSDLSKLINDLRQSKQEVEQAESRDKGPTSLQVPAPGKIIVSGQDPTTGG